MTDNGSEKFLVCSRCCEPVARNYEPGLCHADDCEPATMDEHDEAVTREEAFGKSPRTGGEIATLSIKAMAAAERAGMIHEEKVEAGNWAIYDQGRQDEHDRLATKIVLLERVAEAAGATIAAGGPIQKRTSLHDALAAYYRHVAETTK